MTSAQEIITKLQAHPPNAVVMLGSIRIDGGDIDVSGDEDQYEGFDVVWLT